MPSREDDDKKLAIKTVQLLSFLVTGVLIMSKFLAPDADVPWYAIIFFFGVGAGVDPKAAWEWFRK